MLLDYRDLFTLLTEANAEIAEIDRFMERRNSRRFSRVARLFHYCFSELVSIVQGR